MSIININEDIEVQGEMSFNISKIDDQGNLSVTGTLLIKEYLEDIREIESDRYVLRDVEIVSEDFGTNDSNILYSFSALDYDIKY